MTISHASTAKAIEGRMLTFDIGSEAFAIRADCVREILEVPHITQVPGAPAFINALINVRGTVAPLTDLRIPFLLDATTHNEDTRVIVIEELIEGVRETLAILADKVNDVCELDGGQVEQAPAIGTRWRPDLIEGIGRKGDRFVVVPDIARIVGEFSCCAENAPATRF